MPTKQPRQAVRRKRKAMPIIIRDVPPGYSWGWYSREDPRMHLQSVDEEHRNEHKVWLESHGRRVVEPANKVPPKVLKSLQAAIIKNRRIIEDRWVSLMIRKGWLQARLAIPHVNLTAYPNTPNRFTRVVDLTEDLTDAEIQALRREDITLSAEMASLQIWPSRPEDQRQDIRLSTILWQE